MLSVKYYRASLGRLEQTLAGMSISQFSSQFAHKSTSLQLAASWRSNEAKGTSRCPSDPSSNTNCKDYGVAILTLDNPPLNLTTLTTLDKLQAACNAIASDDRVRVLVVTGAAARRFAPART